MKTSIPYCFLNGAIIPVNKASVSLYDIGLLRGYAIYDGITTFNNKIFQFADHMKRFRHSAQSLGLKVPYSNQEIEKIIYSLIKKNSFERTNLRLILTGGQTIAGIEYDPQHPTFFILAEPFSALPKVLYTKGAKLMTLDHQRFMPESKTTNYITATQFQRKRKKEKAIEILFVHNGKVLECATSNVAIFTGGTLVTPSHNVLGGITLKVVLTLAKKHFTVEQRDISVEELLSADEVFITSSYKDIIPVVKVDGHIIGDGQVGNNTQILIKDFAVLTRNY
ncbi:MAG: branched-chain amino acid aminotransferase [Patescibacteria group bacterium]|nr:branched-chain amino acid aminotransferase [Patescibacteria group bacterium]